MIRANTLVLYQDQSGGCHGQAESSELARAYRRKWSRHGQRRRYPWHPSQYINVDRALANKCHPRKRVVRRALQSGFTLVEAISTMVILAALGTVASAILFTATDGYLSASTTAQLHTELSISLDRIVRELRKIELDSGAAGVAPNIESVTSSSITWSDSDGDSYSLSLSGSDLMLAVDGGLSAVLLGDVTSLTFQTYDESSSTLGSSLSGSGCDPIRRIEITVTCQRQGVSETLRTKVFLRSTMQGAGE